MSIQSAKDFVDRIKTDEVFSKKVKGCKNPKERMTFAKKAGFDFTIEEIKEVNSQLSDGELDLVAGGGDQCENLFCWLLDS